ncbi:hypothetical protein TWF730_002054 [Orbilia blumenaviensis]|uniref:Uncharacterized protein n=1 Tax=Orbilia blumenaviensis TaxID=1796055 RepID=A0AAV9UH54_9PEZI
MSNSPPPRQSTPAKGAGPSRFARFEKPGKAARDHPSPNPPAGNSFNFGFNKDPDGSISSTANLPAEGQTSAVMPLGAQASIAEPEVPASRVGDDAEESEILATSLSKVSLKEVPSEFIADFQESLKMSGKLHKNLQRLASCLASGTLDTATEQWILGTGPRSSRADQSANDDLSARNTLQAAQKSVGLGLFTRYEGSMEGSMEGLLPESDVGNETKVLGKSEIGGPNQEFMYTTDYHKSLFVSNSQRSAAQQSTSTALDIPFLPTTHTQASTEISSPSLKPTFPAANTSDFKKALPISYLPAKRDSFRLRLEQVGYENIAKVEKWTKHVPVSKSNQRHVHAFDTDKPIIDLPTGSKPKLKDTSLRFSPPNPNEQTRRRHSDSFCSTNKFESAIMSKHYDFKKHLKENQEPQSSMEKMEQVNHPEKTLTRGEETEAGSVNQIATEVTPAEQAGLILQDEVDQGYNPPTANVALRTQELRSDPFFQPLSPWKEIKTVSEKNRRFGREFYGEYFDNIWIKAYHTVKNRRFGRYNPIEGRRTFDRRRGEREVYDPSSDKTGTVQWKTHQIFECYFGMREVIGQMKNLDDEKTSTEKKVQTLQERFAKGEYGEFRDPEHMATHIRALKLQLDTIIPDRLMKFKVRQVLMKRAAETNLWDIAKQDIRYVYQGELLNGVLYMRDYFADIQPELSDEEIDELGKDMRHEDF